MTVPEHQLRDRTKAFALRIIRLYTALPKRPDVQVLAKQLVRSGTAVGANHRAACRARSPKEFIAKLGVVVEEADETQFWLELLVESGMVRKEKLEDLLSEAQQLTAIFTSAHHTAKMRSGPRL